MTKITFPIRIYMGDISEQEDMEEKLGIKFNSSSSNDTFKEGTMTVLDIEEIIAVSDSYYRSDEDSPSCCVHFKTLGDVMCDMPKSKFLDLI